MTDTHTDIRTDRQTQEENNMSPDPSMGGDIIQASLNQIVSHILQITTTSLKLHQT